MREIPERRQNWDSGMRIIHVIDSLDPAQGGPPVVAMRLAAAQATLGHRIEIVSLEHSADQNPSTVPGAEIPGFGRVQITLCRRDSWFDRFVPSSAIKHLRTSVDRDTILHIHGMWRPLLLAAAKIGVGKGAPFVVAPHGMLSVWSLGQKPWKKRLALSVMWRAILQHASFLHVLNVDEAKWLEPLGLRVATEIIPNGVFPEEINSLPQTSSFYRMCPELRGRPYILFLGRLHHVKGLDFLANAFCQFARTNEVVDLVVAGPDYGGRADFARIIANQGLTSRVHIVGAIYGEAKYAAMVDAWCLCQPSRHEGFSMTITEAMACGLPVVISENCHFPDVTGAGAGVVVKLDSQSICAGLQLLLADDDSRRRAGLAARELILSRYTWPEIAKKSIDAYRRISTKGASPNAGDLRSK